MVSRVSDVQDYQFPWPLLEVALDGISILDVPHLEVRSMEEATSFLHAYGYDPGSQEDIDHIWGYIEGAVAFIEKTLHDPEYPRVPDHMRSREAIKDLRRILVMASQTSDSIDRLWACAILRVAHVLIHLAHDPRLRYFEQAQNQVLGRLDGHLYVDSSDGAIYLGKKEEGGGVKLLFFKKKDRKDRDREVIKLLHKAENTVEVIYDRIGFRLVTENKVDAMRAVRFLLHKNVISTPSIRPSRVRNRLIDTVRFKAEMEKLVVAISKSKKKAIDIPKWIRRIERRIYYRKKDKNLANPNSSEYYKAIQFTCRELVKVAHPQFHAYSSMQKQLESLPGGRQIFNEIFPHAVPPHEYYFFPYEIQIMDVKSYADSIFGKSNHEEYRRKQHEVARNRVFGRRFATV